MANISEYLNKIKKAIYGEEVRGSIHDAIEAMNKESSEAREVAITSQESAANSAKAAKTSEDNAKTSEGKAKTSEDNAKTSETNAKTSETNASNSATNAATAEANAKKSETAAKNSETNAKTSETNAKTSEGKAKTSEDNAKTSETNAKSSETKAKASETNAASSESKAKTSEANAKTSENNAKTYATNANNSANVATMKVSEIAGKAESAAESAAEAEFWAGQVENKVDDAKIVRLRESLIKGSAEGEEIIADNSAEIESVLQISGNTEQDTRSGKNLFNMVTGAISNATKTINGNSITITSTLETGGFSAYSHEFSAKPNTTYYIKSKSTRTGNHGGGIVVQAKNSEGVSLGNIVDKKDILNTEGSFTTPNDTVTLKVYLYACGDTGMETTYQSATYTNVQLEQGSTATEYESYGTMPSPGFESPIRSVKSKSDNLFDASTKLDNASFNWANGSVIGDATGKVFSDFIALNSNVKYISSNYKFYIAYYDSSKNYLGNSFDLRTYGGILYQENCPIPQGVNVHYCRIVFPITTFQVDGITDMTVITDIMVNKGTIVLPYQPYGYVPAKIKLEGKNLVSETEHSWVGSDGSMNASEGNILSNFIEVEQNESYILSGYYPEFEEIKRKWQIALYDSEFNFISRITSIPYNTAYKISDKNIKYIRGWIDRDPTLSIIPTYLQIEKGTEITSYEPYKYKTIDMPLGDIELRSALDGERENFSRVDGAWKKHNIVGSAVYDGSSDETWSFGTTSTDPTKFRVFTSDLVFADSHVANARSNMFKGASYNLFWERMGLEFRCAVSNGTSGGKNRLFFTTDYSEVPINSADEWRAFLASNPVEVEYKLATPEYTPITDDSLISVLDELEQLVLYEGYNRITVESVNGVKAYLHLDYYKSTEMEIERVVSEFNEEIQAANNENLKLSEEVSRLRANQISGTLSGTEIVVDDSAEMESVLQISGNSEQDTRSGKNLFDNSVNILQSDLTKVTIKENIIEAEITSTSSSYTSAVIPIKNSDKLFGKILTLSGNFTQSANNKGQIRLVATDDDGYSNIEIGRIETNGKSATVTMPTEYPDGTSRFGLRFYSNAGGTGVVGDKIIYENIQLEEGDTATEYEAYGLKPSPDFESPIRSVKSKSDNLLNLTGVSNVDIGNLSNGEITLTWSSGFDCFLLHDSGQKLTGLESNQTYTISFKHKGNAIQLYDYNTSTSNGVSTQNDSDYLQYSFTVKNVTELRLDIIRVDESGTCYIKDVQVNKGSVVLHYQPYGYIPLKFKLEGKNLLQLKVGGREHLGITFEPKEDGTVVANGTSTGSAYWYSSESKDLSILPKGTYTISAFKNKGYVANTQIKLFIKNNIEFLIVDNIPKVFTITEDTEYRIGLRVPNGVTLNNYVFYPMIIEGSYTADTLPKFEPYKLTSIELPFGDMKLCLTPDGTRDTIVRKDGAWNKKNNVGNTIVNGQNGQNASLVPSYVTENHNAFTITGIKPIWINAACQGYSDKFKVITSGDDINGKDEPNLYFGNVTKSEIWVKVSKEIAPTVEDFRTWLPNNPIEIQYPLAEPTYTPITDETLIQALDELERLILHKGYNRITVESANGIKAYLDLSYYKDINKVLDNMNAAILALGGGLSV